MRYSWVLLLMFIVMFCNKQNEITNKHEAFRPYYHFTPASGWMNDPNGMFYLDGEYHLFYQHYPDSTVWGPMHWGHAVSKDLIHWEHLPIALYPDSLGYIFSGSAVVDWKNTSGLGSETNPPVVAIYTYHNAELEKQGRNDFQTQGIAYSLDKGRTWIKYDKNPVVNNPGIRDFRDPKVAWNELANQWVMTLAVKDHIEFYGSSDLKVWSKLSDFGLTFGAHGGVWECPDLFSLTDNNGNKRWVLFVSINPGGPQGGSATQYFVGDFDGKKFIPQDSTIRWIDYGADNYAGVTWSDIPETDGRRIFIGWMSNWQYANVVPTQSWRSATTIPREITLLSKTDGYELQFKPAKELSLLSSESNNFEATTKLNYEASLVEFEVDNSKTFTLKLSNDSNEEVIIEYKNDTLFVDRSKSGIVEFSKDFQATHKTALQGVDVRTVKAFLDAASIEIFINEGERVFTEIVFPTTPYSELNLAGGKRLGKITMLNKSPR